MRGGLTPRPLLNLNFGAPATVILPAKSYGLIRIFLGNCERVSPTANRTS